MTLAIFSFREGKTYKGFIVLTEVKFSEKKTLNV